MEKGSGRSKLFRAPFLGIVDERPCKLRSEEGQMDRSIEHKGVCALSVHASASDVQMA